MKKLIVLFRRMFFIMGNAFAQKGIQAAGVHLSYGTEIETIGIGVKYQYNITDNIRFEPSLNYSFENDFGTDQFDINANLHYLFPMASYVRVYPLAGLTFARYDNVETHTRLGVNAGGGAEFDMSNNLILNLELKYQFVSDADQAFFNVGIAYIF